MNDMRTTKPQPIPAPENRRLLDYVIPLLFAVAAVVVAALVFDRGFSSYDDGVAAEGARLVLHGGTPYRDFWALYGPASYYANALALKLMGESMFAIRFVLLPLVFVQALLLCCILRRVTGNRVALAAAALAYLCVVPVSMPMTSPLTYWATATLAAAYFLLRWIEKPGAGWEVGLGATVGVCALYRQDGGLYTAVALLPIVWLASRDRKVRLLPSLARIYLSFAAVIGAAALYLDSRGALAAAYQDAVCFAAFGFPGSRNLPYPLPWSPMRIIGDYFAPSSVAFLYQLFTYYVLPASLLALVISLARKVYRGEAGQTEVAIAALLTLAVALVLMVRARPSGARIVSSAVLSLAAFGGLAGLDHGKLRTAGLALLAGAVVAYAGLGAATIWAQRNYATSLVTMRGGVYAAPGHAEMLSLTSLYIKEHTRPSEKILSGSPFIYFAAGRDPATVYMEPHPCLSDTKPVQRRIIRDMERSGVRYFIRSREWGEDAWFTIEPENQPRMLIRYIQRHFDPVETIGRFEIYRRATQEGDNG